jgi:hypothetical protein
MSVSLRQPHGFEGLSASLVAERGLNDIAVPELKDIGNSEVRRRSFSALAVVIGKRRPHPRSRGHPDGAVPKPCICPGFRLSDDEGSLHARRLVAVDRTVELVLAGLEGRSDGGGAILANRGAELLDAVSLDPDRVVHG